MPQAKDLGSVLLEKLTKSITANVANEGSGYWVYILNDATAIVNQADDGKVTVTYVMGEPLRLDITAKDFLNES